MDFMEALRLAIKVIREAQDGLDEIYLYEKNSQTQIYLKDCEGSLEFTHDETLPIQIYLASFLDKRNQRTGLNLYMIFSKRWEVRLRKTQHLKAGMRRASEEFIDYTPVVVKGEVECVTQKNQSKPTHC